LTGTAQRIAGSDDETGTATLLAMAGGYSKVNMNFASGPRNEIRTPSGIPLAGAIPAQAPATTQGSQPVGAWSGPDGVIHGIAQNNMLNDPIWFFPAFTVARLTELPDSVLSYIGPETLNGEAVVHIAVSQQFASVSSSAPQIAALLNHLSQMNIYLDATTLIPAAISFNTHPADNGYFDVFTEILFSNYQAVNGIRVPFHVQKFMNYGLVLDLQFSSILPNSGLTAAQFQLP
jgi:hypothetical protein